MADLRRAELWRNDGSALGVACLASPQGVAYALIAGIPPVIGLYAATVPTIIGSLMRSSRHVITGPTNAVSLLVGMTPTLYAYLQRTGAAEVVGQAKLFPSEPGRWFLAQEDAMCHALAEAHAQPAADCPLRIWLAPGVK